MSGLRERQKAERRQAISKAAIELFERQGFQNTTIEQMKMFLTRLGYGSTAVVTGDLTQIDLPKHVKSGLRDAIDVLREVEGVSFTFFEARDVVRHPLVAKIVRAYEKQSIEQGIEQAAGARGEQ